MIELFSDLHIHSCLSPCADDDMTPANICGMAALKGLQMIAVTDHNTARNLPAVKTCCDAYGLLMIPGMEITTKEEVHLLGYFATVEDAMDFSEFLRPHMPPKKNRPQFFGNQLVMDEDDNALYNKMSGGVRIAALNTAGVLYILEKGNTVNSVADLKGRTIYAVGQGSNPEYVLRYILSKNGIDPDKDVTISFLDSAELTTRAATGDIDVCMLPVPAVTTVLIKNKA